ncbi:hypothetical protein BST81_12130 [Leptolyngbya sp. 'hensonii']|nr:hypothetical protein BST81_12130 [Leptolyngbya sp. 'hensonii']
MFQRHPKGLLILIAYKGGTALFLSIVSIALNFAWIRHAALSQYTLTSHRFIVTWVLEHLTEIPNHTLQYGAIAALLYSAISAIEAIGLWYEWDWARWLLLLGVGLSLPFELLEVVRKVSGLRVLLLVANSLAFWYVLRRFPKHSEKE